MREAVIVAMARTAVGKAHKGATRAVRPDELAAVVIKNLLEQTDTKLNSARIEDVILGCAYPEATQGYNVARIVALRSGLPVSVPGLTVNRFCSSGLQAIAIAAERIMVGSADVIIAGGVESMSLIQRGGFNYSPNPFLMAHDPEVYMNMGLTAEQVATEYQISREAMDEFACNSHASASRAQDAGYFAQEIVPVEVEASADQSAPRPFIFQQDEHLRRETTVAGLAALKPVFQDDGRVTAGNSSPLSDGAAALLLMEKQTALKLGLQPLARFVGFNVCGVRPEVMGIGPVEAVPRVLRQIGMNLNQIDLIELNEAFAAQAIAVVRELDLNPALVNVNGGAIALGHPLGCTGAKLSIHLINELRRRKGQYGLVTMCVGGGMGAAGIFEALN